MSKRMQEDTEFSDSQVGLLNMAFLLFLGIGFEFNGHIGDRYKPKQFLVGGMLITSLVIMLIFFIRVIGITSIVPFVILQILNGFAESACFPSYIRILGNWYSENNRAIVMTLWSGSRNLGDVTGTILGSIMIKSIGLSWHYSLFIVACLCLTALYFINLKLSNSPAEIGLEINKRQRQSGLVESSSSSSSSSSQVAHNPNQKYLDNFDQDSKSKNRANNNNNKNIDCDNNNNNNNNNGGQQHPISVQNEKKINIDDLEEPEQLSDINIQSSVPQEKELKTITVRQAFMIPGVPFYMLGYMCLKSLNYGLIFWLPKYMQDNGLDRISDSVTIIWSIGVLLGGFLGGFLSDRFRLKALLMPPFLILLILSLFAFGSIQLDEKKAPLFYLLSFVMGVFQGQPQNLISGPILVDLGKHPRLRGQAQAVGTVTGIIEGAGSLCAALVQIVIPSIGEKNIFILFMLMALACFISLLPVAVSEYLHKQKEKKLLLKQNNLSQPLNENEQKVNQSSSQSPKLQQATPAAITIPPLNPPITQQQQQQQQQEKQPKSIFPSIFPTNKSEKGLLGDFQQPQQINQMPTAITGNNHMPETQKQLFESPFQVRSNDVFVNSQLLKIFQQDNII